MSNVSKLKEALVRELLDQVENGRLVPDADGNPIRVSVDSKVMTVAAKVVKDFAHEIEDPNKQAQELEKLDRFLAKRRNGSNVIALAADTAH